MGWFLSAIVTLVMAAAPSAFACQMIASQQEVEAHYTILKAQCARSGGSWSTDSPEDAPLPFNPPAQVTDDGFKYNPNDTEQVRQQKFVQWKEKLAQGRGAYQAEYQKYTEQYHKENAIRMLTVRRTDSCQDRYDKETKGSVIAGCYTTSCNCGENMCFSLEDNACVQYEAWKLKSSGES